MKKNDHFKRVRVFLEDKEKKSYSKIFKEVLQLWYFNKHFPLYYFGRFLYRKDIPNYKDYLSLKQYYRIIKSKKLNKVEFTNILANKLAFALFCEQTKIPAPTVLGYNMKKTFFLGGEKITMDSIEELKQYFTSLFKKNSIDKIFIKTLSDSGGKGVFMVDSNTLDLQDVSLFNKILNSACIHQQGVVQHSAINAIYSKSVNTIRIDTYIDDLNIPHVLSTTMRIGSGGNTVDNVSSGGFFVPADLVSGELLPHALQSMIFGGKKFTKHPDTGFEFRGFKIPYFQEAKDLCLSTSMIIPNRLIGWDIAITPHGPIIIEGNPAPGFLIGEYYHGGYLKHPLGKEMLENA